MEEASPATASNTPLSAQVVRPKARPDGPRQSQSLQDSDLESRQKQHRAPSPSEHHRSKAGRRGRTRQHRRPAQGRTAVGDQPSGPSFAEERQDMHAVEVTQHFFEAVSTQLERWYERKVAEARGEAFQRTQAERAALVERIAQLEEQLRLLRTNRKDHC